MRIVKKFFIMVLTITVMLQTVMQPVYASSASVTNNDMYAKNVVETINIEGINYTYHYFYSGENRAIEIANDVNNNVDIIIYDEVQSKMYVNGQEIVFVDCTAQTPALMYTDDWETIGTGSHYISWAQGTTVSVVAACFAAYLGSLGAKAVILAMGASTLSILASNCIGGTLYVESQWCHIMFTEPQYRYVWSFTASSGDSYGPYIAHYTV